MNVRFTAWLSEAEREGIRDMATMHGTSDNYMIRVAVRMMLGLPIQRVPEVPASIEVGPHTRV